MTESVNGKYGQASVGMHRVVLSIACRDADLHDNADARLVDTAVIGWLGQAEALAGLAVGAAI
ncbi:MAG: hypothetical protein ABWY49_14100 [Rhizobium sp.]